MKKEHHSSVSGAETTYKARNLGMTNNRPSMDAEEHEFDEHMTNTGERAQELARKLTKGIGPEFPVK